MSAHLFEQDPTSDPSPLRAQRMTADEAKAVIDLWQRERDEQTGLTDRPAVPDVAEGLDIGVEDVQRLLAEVREHRVGEERALAYEQELAEIRLAEEERKLAEVKRQRAELRRERMGTERRQGQTEEERLLAEDRQWWEQTPRQWPSPPLAAEVMLRRPPNHETPLLESNLAELDEHGQSLRPVSVRWIATLFKVIYLCLLMGLFVVPLLYVLFHAFGLMLH